MSNTLKKKTKLFSQSESTPNPNCTINHYKISGTNMGNLTDSRFCHLLYPFRATTRFYDWKGNVPWRSEYIKKMSKINKKLSADLGTVACLRRKNDARCSSYHNTIRAYHRPLGTLYSERHCDFRTFVYVFMRVVNVFLRKELGKSPSLFLGRISPLYRYNPSWIVHVVW